MPKSSSKELRKTSQRDRLSVGREAQPPALELPGVALPGVEMPIVELLDVELLGAELP